MHIKKKILCLLLTACLLAGAMAFPQQAAASSVYFSAVNDTPLELSAGSMPAYIGGALYVPYTMFNNSILGVYFSYDRTEQKASLLYGGKQIYFDMAAGETFDAEGNSYTATASFYNGKIYLPVSFICSFFGFSYSYINSEGLGAIIRVKDANVVLSDAMYEKAARSVMSDQLNKYLGGTAPEVSPSPSDEPEEHTDIRVHLGLTGLADAEPVLDSLADYGMRATFFVTGEEIRENADLVRRILCQGHKLGIDLAREERPEEAFELLFAAARRSTLLVSGGDAPQGCVRCIYDMDAAEEELSIYSLRTGAIYGGRRFAVHLDCGEDGELLSAFLAYLNLGQFTVVPFNELSGGNVDG